MPILKGTGIHPRGRAPTQHSLFQQILPFGALGRAFRVYPDEWRLLAWVTLIQLIMSASTIMISNVAQTAFLKRFGVEALPVVFLGEALITFIVAGGLSMLMGRFRSLRVFTGLLLFYGICVGSIRPLLATDAQWVYPVLFILKSQAVGLLPILFWDILGDLFTTQQSKRLYTLVVAGGVLGTSVGSMTTRPMAAWLGTDNLLLVFAVGMGLAAVLNSFTEKVTGAPIQPHGKKPAAPRGRRYAETLTSFLANARQSKLLRYMIVLLAIPNMMLPLLDYQFNVLVDNYFESEALMLQFFGLFRGISNAVIFIALMLSSRLISRWGVPRSLIFHPINYAVAFIAIFLRFDLIAGVYARFSTELIKTALNNPARAVLYNFFPQHLRATARIALRGGVVRLSDFAGSGFLALIRGSVDPRMLSLIAVPLAAIWTVTTFRLKSAYPDILIQSLAEEQKDLSSLEDVEFSMLSGDRQAVDTFRRGLSSPDTQTAEACAQFMLLAKPPGWQNDFLKAVMSQGAATQRPLLLMINAEDIRDHLPALYSVAAGAPPDTLWVWLEALARLDPSGSSHFLEQYVDHPDPLARREALAGMGRSGNPRRQATFRHEVRRLLAGDAEQNKMAIILIGKSGDSRFDQPLLETLSGSEDLDLIEWSLEGLARMRHPALLAPAVMATRHPVPRIRMKALEALRAIGNHVPVARIISLLKDPDSRIRRLAATVIRDRGPGETDALLAALATPNHRQRVEVAELIRQLGVPGVAISRFVMGELRLAYELRGQIQVLRGAVTGEAGRLLLEYLAERQAEKTAVGLHAIGAMIFGDRMMVVLKALDGGDKRDRDNAIEAIENALHPQIRSALMPLLKASPENERLRQREGGPTWGKPHPPSPGETLSRLLGMPDPILISIIREVMGEHPSLASAVTVAADAAPPLSPDIGIFSPAQAVMDLRRVPLFADVPLKVLGLVAGEAEILTAQAGETLLAPEMKQGRVILVCSGRLVADASPFLTNILAVSRITGDVACLGGTGQPYTIRCETAARIMVFSCAAFQGILMDNPEITLNLCAHFSQVLRKYHQRV